MVICKPRSRAELLLWILVCICAIIHYILGIRLTLSIDFSSDDNTDPSTMMYTLKQQQHNLKKEFSTSISSTTTTPTHTEGFSACLLILDDYEILAEWLAYHYTTLPLHRLIIGLDPKNSKQSINKIYHLTNLWKTKRADLNITIWASTSFANYTDCRGVNERLCDKYRRGRLGRYEPNFMFSIHQRDLNLKCLLEHKRYYHQQQKLTNNVATTSNSSSSWVILTDTDEFLTYNYIKPNHENYSRYEWQQKKSSKKKPQIDETRKEILPLRKLQPKFENKTLLSFIEYYQTNNEYRFPTCIHSVGLFFGNYTTKPGKLAVTQRYRHHENTTNGLFSKAMIDVSRAKYKHFSQKYWDTIHNPSTKTCGRNFPLSVGIDYMSSVFRINHYIGPIGYYYRRNSDIREDGAENRYNSKLKAYEPYDLERADDSMLHWLDRFAGLVGGIDIAEVLLFAPLRNNYVP